MATESDTRRQADAGAGDAHPARRPEQAQWRLRPMLAELRDDAGDLAAHLLLHWRLILGLAVAAGFGALAFAWSGLYSVAATSGHYPFFRYLLGYALRQSVETHTIGLTVPGRLDEPALLRRGAGHYQGGCAPCHGAPGQPRNPITRRMLPEPPYLVPRIAEWTPVQLFWIVKHGIKYAGMPAWVAPEREDEVWSVVAFLLRLPELDVPAYRRLAYGEVSRTTSGATEGIDLLLLNGPTGNGIAACARCHGRAGAGDPDGAFPRLQGQTEAYLYDALQAYALGERPSGIMQPVAAGLDEAEMRLLARHYAGQEASERPGQDRPAAQAAQDRPMAQAAQLELGRRIAQQGLPERGVAACAGCHGPKPEGLHPTYPRLAGQQPGYVAAQLELWMRAVRGGIHEAPTARIMARAVGIDPERPPARQALWPLQPEEMRAVAAWYAAEPAAPPALAER